VVNKSSLIAHRFENHPPFGLLNFRPAPDRNRNTKTVFAHRKNSIASGIDRQAPRRSSGERNGRGGLEELIKRRRVFKSVPGAVVNSPTGGTRSPTEGRNTTRKKVVAAGRSRPAGVLAARRKKVLAEKIRRKRFQKFRHDDARSGIRGRRW